MALLWAQVASAQVFSPGELAKAHQELEGLTNCKKCHGDGEQVSQAKCLDCHAELKQRVAQGKGFHGRMAEGERACQKCHHEHQGRAFALIDWVPSKKQFPHAKVGWALEGKHAKVACDDCHRPELITDSGVRQRLAKHRGARTYLGLGTRCESCHFDEHRGQLEGRCDSCHDVSGWKPAKGFSHDETGYQLTGRHRQVKCDACHPRVEDTAAATFPRPVSSSFLKLEQLPHQSCLDCHSDPHDNRFGARCESCHTTADWRRVKTPGGSRGFHDKTRFKLEGAHTDVECRACHGPFRGIRAKFKGLPFSKCTDCHADAHLGQLKTAQGKVQPCESCHTVEAFIPARFELPEHQKTRFALEGAHQAVACDDCHQKDRSLEKKIPTAVKKDLARRKRPANFSLARFHFTADPAQCQSCHPDPHAKQFDDRQSCTTCHRLSGWAELKFDHSKDSRFPLTGAHQKTACGSCHLRERVGGVNATRYKPLEQECDACHADPHAGQFAGGGGRTDCARCHDTAVFKETRFVHAPPFTRFVLDGKHEQAACEACHPSVTLAGGAKTRRYVALPTQCEGCHHDYHRGDFKGFAP